MSSEKRRRRCIAPERGEASWAVYSVDKTTLSSCNTHFTTLLSAFLHFCTVFPTVPYFCQLRLHLFSSTAKKMNANLQGKFANKVNEPLPEFNSEYETSSRY
jgi:hypothetical protein